MGIFDFLKKNDFNSFSDEVKFQIAIEAIIGIYGTILQLKPIHPNDVGILQILLPKYDKKLSEIYKKKRRIIHTFIQKDFNKAKETPAKNTIIALKSLKNEDLDFFLFDTVYLCASGNFNDLFIKRFLIATENENDRIEYPLPKKREKELYKLENKKVRYLLKLIMNVKEITAEQAYDWIIENQNLISKNGKRIFKQFKMKEIENK